MHGGKDGGDDDRACGGSGEMKIAGARTEHVETVKVMMAEVKMETEAVETEALKARMMAEMAAGMMEEMAMTYEETPNLT